MQGFNKYLLSIIASKYIICVIFIYIYTNQIYVIKHLCSLLYMHRKTKCQTFLFLFIHWNLIIKLNWACIWTMQDKGHSMKNIRWNHILSHKLSIITTITHTTVIIRPNQKIYIRFSMICFFWSQVKVPRIVASISHMQI